MKKEGFILGHRSRGFEVSMHGQIAACTLCTGLNSEHPSKESVVKWTSPHCRPEDKRMGRKAQRARRPSRASPVTHFFNQAAPLNGPFSYEFINGFTH